MDLCTVCDRCGSKIDDSKGEERFTYPKSAITILLETGKAQNIELCCRCRTAFMEWLKGGKE